MEDNESTQVEARARDLAQAQRDYKEDSATDLYEVYKPLAKVGLITVGYLGVRTLIDSMVGGGGINAFPDEFDTVTTMGYVDAVAGATSVMLGGFCGLCALIGRVDCRKERKELRSAEKNLQESIEGIQ